MDYSSSIKMPPHGGINKSNSSLAKKADVTALANKVDAATLQNAVENIWYPKSLPSGFNSTDRYSMATLKDGWYWHAGNDGALNFPSDWGFMVKFGYEINTGDFSALFFTQGSGPIYRCSGNAGAISGWIQV